MRLKIPTLTVAPTFKKNLLSVTELTSNNDFSILLHKWRGYLLRSKPQPRPQRVIALVYILDTKYSMRLQKPRKVHAANGTINQRKNIDQYFKKNNKQKK